MVLKEIRFRIKSEINYLFFRRYRFKRTIRRHFRKYYSPDNPHTANTQKQIICMADGKYPHGGLVDRLRSITTIFKYCLEHKVDFRIYFTTPFRLEDYLVPNLYDWRIGSSELSFNSEDSKAVFMDTSGNSGEREKKFQRNITEEFLSAPYKQIHVYSTFYYEERYFGELFTRLFKPAVPIQKEIDEQLRILGGAGNYISVSTRFLELLGDFKEPGTSPHIPASKQTALIQACLKQIEIIKSKHPDIPRILITSDSNRFLEACRQLEYAYIIPGEILHVDIPDKSKAAKHQKTFVDFFAIAHAQKSYLLITDKMYKSSFSMRAAQVYNHPFEIIRF